MGDRTLRAALRYLSQFNAFRTVIFFDALLIVIEHEQWRETLKQMRLMFRPKRSCLYIYRGDGVSGPQEMALYVASAIRSRS